MTALTWPSLARIARWSFHLQNQDRSGGLALNGTEQIIDSQSGRWMAELEVVIAGNAAFLQWEAFLAEMRGRVGTVKVPARQGRRASWPVDSTTGAILSPRRVRQAELDGTIYADPAIPTASAITATASGSASINATAISIAVTQGEIVQAGQYFSPAAGKLHRIRSITSTVVKTSAVVFWPPLRAGVSNGATIELIEPTCEMRFATPEEGRIGDDGSGFERVTVNFEEAF